MFKILIRNINHETIDEEYWLNLCSQKKRESIMKYKHLDQKRSLMAEKMVKEYLIETYGFLIEDLVIESTEKGKPYFSLIKHINFSISHSEDYVMVGISNQFISVDVEKISNDYVDIINILHIEEQNYLKNNHNQIEFYKIWTKKECYVKFLGIGFELMPDEFSIMSLYTNMKSIIFNGYVFTYFLN